MTQQTMFAMARRGVVAAMAVLMAACGGGGSDSDEKLEVTFSYDSAVYLMGRTNVRPKTTGFNGHTPSCALVSGRLPKGLGMNADCSLVGFPEEKGPFSLTVRVSASGVKNTVDVVTSIGVIAPSADYDFNNDMSVSTAVSWRLGETGSYAPINNSMWRPFSDVGTRYFVAEGSLPPGIAIDPSTGVISGTATSLHKQGFRVAVTVSGNGQSVTLQQQRMSTGTTLLSDFYPKDVVATLGEQLRVAPKFNVPPGTSLSFSFTNQTSPGKPLLDGLTLDTRTGEISGYPGRSLDKPEKYTIHAIQISNGVQSQQDWDLMLGTKSSIDFSYAGTGGFIGKQFLNRASVLRLPSGATTSFAADMSVPWPPGITVNATNGDMSGVPTGTFSDNCFVLMTVTLPSGRSFVMRAAMYIAMR